MHHLHFRYVTDPPPFQSLRRFLQLLDDVALQPRLALLRRLLIDFDAISDERDQQVEYTIFKSRLTSQFAGARCEETIVYGIVCRVLGDALKRHTLNLPLLAQKKREMIDILHFLNLHELTRRCAAGV